MQTGVKLLGSYCAIIRHMAALDRRRLRVLDQALHGEFAEALGAFRTLVAEVPTIPTGWASHLDVLEMLCDGVRESFEKSCNQILRSHESAMRNFLQFAACRLQEKTETEHELEWHARDVQWIVTASAAISRMQFLVREMISTQRLEDNWLEYIQNLFKEPAYSLKTQ